jgi:penicillin-binding protein 2
MDTPQKIFKNRYFIFGLVMGMVMILFISRLYKLQIIDGELYISQSVVRIERTYTIEAARGNIYDRNGVLLAYNRECMNVYLTKAFTSSDSLNPALLCLYDILEANGENFLKSLDTVLIYNEENDSFMFSNKWTADDLIKWQTRDDLFARAKSAVQYNADDFFEYLRKYFYVDEEYSNSEAYKIVCMRYEILKNRYEYNNGYMVIATDVSLETEAYVTENSHKLGGVIFRKSYVRAYTKEAAYVGHIVGYVGLVNDDDLKADDTLSDDYMIGKMGIELYCEDDLRGIDGFAVVETDTEGNTLSVISGEKPIDGSDIYLTIDIELQKTALDALDTTVAEIVAKADGTKNFGDANAATSVVLAVKTGEILACANNKSFDPSWFINTDDESQAKMLEALNDDVNFPMYNRALSSTYTPGSILKPLIAISALESGVIDEETKLECKMKVEIGGKLFTCLGWHGSINVSKAIEQSCNIFFNLLGVQTGIDTIDTWVRAYGFGTATGVDLPGESSGILSNPEFKLLRDNLPWHIADTAQSSIGQMFYNFTPIQIVNYTAILASGGEKHTPHVIQRIIDADDEIIYEGDISYTDVGVSDKTDRIIREAMIRVAQHGTASRVFENYPIAVAAKTGTAETGYEENSSSNGLSIAYAPADDPEIAVCVVIEHGVWGSYTVPAIMRIFNSYFNIELEQEIIDDTIVTNEQ